MKKEDEIYVENLNSYVKSLDVFINQQQNAIEGNNWENGFLNREISLKQDRIRLNHEANALARESIKEAEKRRELTIAEINKLKESESN